MNIVERVKNICLTPRTEWPVIAGEPTPAATLISGYVLPLAAIGAAAGFIGGSVVGQSLPFIGTFRVPVATGLGVAVYALVMAIVGVFVLSLVIDALAPTFGGERNREQALKVAVYSYTPAWIAAVFQIVPALLILALVGALYGFYLLYLGLPRLMKSPEDKAVPYTAVVIVCAIVVTVVLMAVGNALVGTAGVGAGLLSRATGQSTPASDLQALAERLEESSDQLEAAAASGDAAAQIAAASEGLGALLGGVAAGSADPVDIAQLTPLLPETFAGLPKTGSNAERTGLAGVMMARTEATYGDGGARDVTLEIVDSGGASGLMSLAGRFGVESQREDEDGFERSRREGTRLIQEKTSKSEGTSELSITLADRFVVTATARGVDLNTLTAAVSAMDLARLESMKGATGPR